MIGIAKRKPVIVHLLRVRQCTHAAKDIALPGLRVILAENLDIDLFPEHIGEFRAFFPGEEIRDDAATFGRTHADHKFAVKIRIMREDFRALVRFGDGDRRQACHKCGRQHGSRQV
jgi:hypothetical protein